MILEKRFKFFIRKYFIIKKIKLGLLLNYNEQKNKRLSIRNKLLINLVVIFLFFSCNKDNQYPLPDIGVREYVNTNNAEYINLKVPGGVVAIDGGINGIIIYRISETSFGVFERTCPHQPELNCAVVGEGATAKCPCCGSTYSLIDGNLIDGPSNWPLRPYNYDFDGAVLWIIN